MWKLATLPLVSSSLMMQLLICKKLMLYLSKMRMVCDSSSLRNMAMAFFMGSL